MIEGVLGGGKGGEGLRGLGSSSPRTGSQHRGTAPPPMTTTTVSTSYFLYLDLALGLDLLKTVSTQRENQQEIPPVLGDVLPQTFQDVLVPTFLLLSHPPTFSTAPLSPGLPMLSGLSREPFSIFVLLFATFHCFSLRFTTFVAGQQQKTRKKH